MASRSVLPFPPDKLRHISSTYGFSKLLDGRETRGESLAVGEFEADVGDALIFNSLVFHRSETNRSNRIKFIVGYMMQDLASMEDPEDRNSPIWDMFEMTRRRYELNQARVAEPA